MNRDQRRRDRKFIAWMGEVMMGSLAPGTVNEMREKFDEGTTVEEMNEILDRPYKGETNDNDD